MKYQGAIIRLSQNLVIILLILTPTTSAVADVAPPHPPPGSDIEPGDESTQVQMINETVVLEITGEDTSFSYLGVNKPNDVQNVYGPEILASAIFTMRNQGTQEERMTVLFPLTWPDGWGHQIEIADFEVAVGTQTLDWQYVENNDAESYGLRPYNWAGFGVTFPSEKNVTIKVSFTMQAEGCNRRVHCNINYLLRTGAGWFGTIEHGEIILKLPYQANKYNVAKYPEGSTFSGNTLTWEFSDLEPDVGDNFRVQIPHPRIWQNIVDAQKKLEQNPDDLAALRQLGEAAYVLSREQRVYAVIPGKQDIFLWAEDAYARAVEIDPNNPSLLEVYLNVLLHHYGGVYRWNKLSFNAPTPTSGQILELAERVQELLPEDHIYYEETRTRYYEEIVRLLNGLSPITPTPVFTTTFTQPVPTVTKIATSIAGQLTDREGSDDANSTLAVSTPSLTPPTLAASTPEEETNIYLWVWITGIIVIGIGSIFMIRRQRE